MSVTTMIVVIVAIAALTMLRIAKYRSGRGRAGLAAQPPADDAEKTALRHEVHDLRERIKVLERIATDANTATAIETRRVADEIEALRDR